MNLFANHLLLVVAAAALGAAAVRAVAPSTPAGLVRVLAAAPVWGALAAGCTLVLGRFGASASTPALVLSALGCWAVAAALVPAAPRGLRDAAAAWWGGASAAQRCALGAVAGLAAATVAWELRYPALGLDGIVYHLGEVAGWVATGDAGSALNVTYEFPVGAYPLTNEVLLAWGTGLAHSFAWVAVLPVAQMALLAAAFWQALRALRVPGAVAVLAVAAIVTVPEAVLELNGPKNDVGAAAWLATAAALVFSSRGNPRLLGPALLAAGLSLGTKTTAAPMIVVLAGVAWAMHRDDWRQALRGLALAGVAAIAVGGVWYLRNALDHGSPLWPFVSLPGGDPVPRFLARIDVSLLSRPLDTLRGREAEYLATLSGGALVLLGGLVAGPAIRTRAVSVAAGATLLGLLAYASAPFTGRASTALLDLSATTTRYLMPVILAAAVAVGLAARDGGAAARKAAAGLFGVALALSAARLAYLGWPRVPSVQTVVVGVGAGAVLAMAAARLRLAPTPALALVAALAGAAGLAAAADGYVARHASASAYFDRPLLEWLDRQPAWRDGDGPIAFAPSPVGPAAGDGLDHDVVLIPADEPCARVRERVEAGWVVIREVPALGNFLSPFTAARCLRGVAPSARFGDLRVYGSG